MTSLHLSGTVMSSAGKEKNEKEHVNDMAGDNIYEQTNAAEKPLIMAADDKPELLTAVVNMLEERFRVMAATGGVAALRLIERHTPVLFLLDIEMPQMDGYQLAERIRRMEKYKTTPIIFLTSKNTREDVVAAIKRGGSDYLVKPVSKDMLMSKVLQHLKMT